MAPCGANCTASIYASAPAACAVAVTADSPSYPERHRLMAVAIAQQVGFQHEIIRTAELERAELEYVVDCIKAGW